MIPSLNGFLDLGRGEKPADRYSRMSKCIVVEDDPFWAGEIIGALTDAGVEIYFASDGTKALEMARSHPDAGMILDIVLPDIDGVEVLQKAQAVGSSDARACCDGRWTTGPGFLSESRKDVRCEGSARQTLHANSTDGQLVGTRRVRANL